MNKIWYILLGIVLISCDEENKCIKTKIDNIFIKEFVTEIDTCNTFEGSSHVKYFYKDSLFMSGFGNIDNKQGYWKFFKDNEVITEGLFKDSRPQGVWKYKNIGEIDWEIYIDKEDGYIVSVPKNWKAYKEENGLSFSNGKNIGSNVLITYDGKPINSIINEIIRDKEERGVSNVKYKKMKYTLKGIDEFYEYTCNFIEKNKDEVKSHYIMFRVEKKTYFISVNLKIDSEYDYSIIEEQILHSFRRYSGL
ncbi:MAG: hypothetical protein HRT66_13555 [Flavobacteriaceae bacterium]|nr:hypothetical protein [Flavobacteriaceae bacterium]